MTTNISTLPLPAEVAQTLSTLNTLQLAWLSGYCWAKAQGSGNSLTKELTISQEPITESVPLSVSVLSASQTGNAKLVADTLAERLKLNGVNVKRTNLADYKAKNLADEKLVLLVTSTQGEGEPPEEGVLLYKWLYGKKAPKLDGLEFAVLGLGDTSYPNFCQAAKDFDQRFEQLGAKRLLERVDADLDFNETANQWIEEITTLIKEKSVVTTPVPQAMQVQSVTVTAISSQYHKSNPFPATLITNQKITARQAEKDIRHIELDLSGSGLHYEAGDALGVWFENDPLLVKEILDLLGLKGDEQVNLNEKTLEISTALLSHLELTQNTPSFVKGYAELVKKKKLNTLIADSDKLQAYVQSTPIVDVLHDYPATLSAEQFVGLLRPLTPRLYSISSSSLEVGEEVHLSVGVVRFQHQGKTRSGGASSFLAERVHEGEQIRIFVEHNNNFRLPHDNTKPIIMIGSGTGIAPFRAFVQQRAAEGAEGKNWLIFGNQHFTQDFLYQTEWQQFAKDGYLHQYDFAWSRDQEEKIYVQHKMLEKSTALWQWLQEGAYIYVCGDAAKMAKDVERTLLDVIIQEGKLSHDEAEEYLDHLREEKRYQRDVY